MATHREVLSYLRPNGGYVAIGTDYEGIQFTECEAFSKEEYEAGFAQYDEWKAEQESVKAAEKKAVLDRIGITEEEAKLILS